MWLENSDAFRESDKLCQATGVKWKKCSFHDWFFAKADLILAKIF